MFCKRWFLYEQSVKLSISFADSMGLVMILLTISNEIPGINMKRLRQCLVTYGLAISLAGCGGLANSQSENQPLLAPPTQPIQEVQKSGKKGATVHIKGKVGDRAPLVEGTVYEVADETGKIWVMTKQPPPETGQEVTVKGVLRFKSILINGQEQGSLYLEQE